MRIGRQLLSKVHSGSEWRAGRVDSAMVSLDLAARNPKHSGECRYPAKWASLQGRSSPLSP